MKKVLSLVLILSCFVSSNASYKIIDRKSEKSEKIDFSKDSKVRRLVRGFVEDVYKLSARSFSDNIEVGITCNNQYATRDGAVRVFDRRLAGWIDQTQNEKKYIEVYGIGREKLCRLIGSGSSSDLLKLHIKYIEDLMPLVSEGARSDLEKLLKVYNNQLSLELYNYSEDVETALRKGRKNAAYNSNVAKFMKCYNKEIGRLPRIAVEEFDTNVPDEVDMHKLLVFFDVGDKPACNIGGLCDAPYEGDRDNRKLESEIAKGVIDCLAGDCAK